MSKTCKQLIQESEYLHAEYSKLLNEIEAGVSTSTQLIADLKQFAATCYDCGFADGLQVGKTVRITTRQGKPIPSVIIAEQAEPGIPIVSNSTAAGNAKAVEEARKRNPMFGMGGNPFRPTVLGHSADGLTLLVQDGLRTISMRVDDYNRM